MLAKDAIRGQVIAHPVRRRLLPASGAYGIMVRTVHASLSGDHPGGTSGLALERQFRVVLSKAVPTALFLAVNGGSRWPGAAALAQRCQLPQPAAAGRAAPGAGDAHRQRPLPRPGAATPPRTVPSRAHLPGRGGPAVQDAYPALADYSQQAGTLTVFMATQAGGSRAEVAGGDHGRDG